MGDSSILIEESRNTLNNQLQEIRDQRNLALKILRIHFAVAGILIATITTLLTTSVQIPLLKLVKSAQWIEITSFFVGLLLIGNGLITFHRGIYNSLEVLSVEEVDADPITRVLSTLYHSLRGNNVPEREAYHIEIGPVVSDVKEPEDSVEAILNRHSEIIETNQDTIDSNNESLWWVYQRMSIGITVTGFGLFLTTIIL